MSNEEALEVLNYIISNMAIEFSNRGLLDAVKCGRDALKKQNTIQLAKDDGGDMMGLKIDIPFEVGDPVLRLLYTQHDGYYISADMFSYTMIEEYVNGYIFRDYASAKNKLEEINNAR